MSRQPLVLAILLALASTQALASDWRHDDSCRTCRERFGHGYDPFDDGTEAWFAPNGGSWADHADAYFGYGECHFVRAPVPGQWGEVVDDRRVRVCD